MLPTPPSSPTCFGPKFTTAPEHRLGTLLLDRIQLSEILGVGSYGVVYKAVDICNGTPFAVKVLNKVGLDSRQRQFQQREIQLHHEASGHRNVVSVHRILDYADCTFVILEYCPDGDLFINITDRGLYSGNNALAKSIFLQILDAVEYCHSIGIYHRDLKPENVLVADGGMTVKLADFGLATTDTYSSDFGCGSTFYMSPECQQPSPRPFSAYAAGPNDVWSLGVILINLTCSRNPWKQASPADSTFDAFLRDAEFLKSILPLTHEMDCILRRIFESDPCKRVTIPELRHMIIRCSAFTKPGQTSLPTPPPEPVYYADTSLSGACADMSCLYAAEQASINAQNCSQPQHPAPMFNAHFAPPSPAYSSHTTSCETNPTPIASPNIHAQPTLERQQAPSAMSTWYSNIIPALDIAQKHMSFHPVLPGFRLF